MPTPPSLPWLLIRDFPSFWRTGGRSNIDDPPLRRRFDLDETTPWSEAETERVADERGEKQRRRRRFLVYQRRSRGVRWVELGRRTVPMRAERTGRNRNTKGSTIAGSDERRKFGDSSTKRCFVATSVPSVSTTTRTMPPPPTDEEQNNPLNPGGRG